MKVSINWHHGAYSYQEFLLILPQSAASARFCERSSNVTIEGILGSADRLRLYPTVSQGIDQKYIWGDKVTTSPTITYHLTSEEVYYTEVWISRGNSYLPNMNFTRLNYHRASTFTI